MSRLFYAGARVYGRLEHCANRGHVFCIDGGQSRSFVRFDSFEEFELWYTKLAPNMRTLSEVVTSDMRKLVLDIDSPEESMLEKLFMYDFEKHVTSRIHEVFFMLDIGAPDVAFYSMCSDNKISYHVVITNFLFSAQTCLGLCAAISSGQLWEPCVDMGVYKRVQSIRIEHSTKHGEQRWKQRLGRQGPLRQGILSDTVGTSVTGMCAVVRSCMLRSVPFSIRGFEHINTQFRVGKPRAGGIVPLYRTRPGFCFQCNRRHDRENAFIRYTEAGVPVFTCWRYRS